MSIFLSYAATTLLIICCIVSFFQIRFFFKKYEDVETNHFYGSLLQFLSCLLSFFILIYIFLSSDFNFQLVYNHSHSEKPFLYKLSGAWGNHEGSLLMWILILTIFNFSYAIFKSYNQIFKNKVIAIQSFLIFGFILFSLFTSSPFNLAKNIYSEGLGLNPILQDPLLAIHPPILYLGYVGFSIVFSFAIAGLLNNKIDNEWASVVKPWLFVAWIFLTSGIVLGSYWAYYELGWGGYWFWDPVENASLMPWLSATALLHCIIVLEQRNTLQSWTALLSILTFSLSLMGTFLVRSGVLNSVHTFASDPSRGLFILIFLGLVLFGSFYIFASKASSMEKQIPFEIISRDTGMLINNWLLLTVLFVVFLGTMYPLVTDLVFETSLTVGPNYYSITIIPIVILILIFMTITPLLNWTSDNIGKVFIKIKYPLILSLTIVFSVSLFFHLFSITEIIILFLSLVLVLSSISSGIRIHQKGFIISSKLGKTFAHSGFGLLIFAIIANATYSEERIYDAKVNDVFNLSSHTFVFKKIEQTKIDNYYSIQALFYLTKNNEVIDEFYPEIRFYDNPPTITSETSISHSLFKDIYMVMNVPQSQDSINLRIHIKPFMNFIWLSIFMIVFGGIFSIIFRKKI